MLDKKQILVIFLFEFRIGHKAVETTCSINNTFGPETANTHTVQLCFEEFCKGDENIEDQQHRGQPLEVDPLRGSLKLIPLQLPEKLLRNSTSTILQLFGNWSKLERWKSSISGGLIQWPQMKKNHFEVSSSLILCNNNKPFLDQIVTCDEKWVLYDHQQWPAQWLEQEEAPNHLPKPNLHQKNVTVTVWWSNPLQLSESWQNHYIWELCSANSWDAPKTAMPCSCHWSTEKVQFFSMTTPEHTLHGQASKVEQIVLWGLASSIIFTDLSPTDRHFFKHLNNLLWGRCFHSQEETENAFQEFTES